MKNIILISIICTFNNILFAQNSIITGVLQSDNNNNPIPYATIVDPSSPEYGTSTDINGKFEFSLPSKNINGKLYISSLGYLDTVLNISEIRELKKPILLKEKSILLKEVIISPDNNKIKYLGKPYAPLGHRDMGININSSIGVYFDIDKRKRGIITSIYIGIGNRGFTKAPFTLRLLVSKQKPKPNKFIPISQYYDILPTPLYIKAQHNGWLEIQLSKYNIPLPSKNGLFIVITPLNIGKKYEWSEKVIFTEYEKKVVKNYGISIQSYKKPQQDNVFYAFMFWKKTNNTFIRTLGYAYPSRTVRKYVPPLAIAISYNHQ